MGRRLYAAVSALVVLGLTSRLYQTLAERRDTRRYPPPGELVDIGGRRIHLWRAGSGTPSVVVVPALGTPGSEWLNVQRGLAPYASVYVYDRGGLGWSDPAPWPRTYARMADELLQLLTAACIPQPYLLVGHSVGGIIARQFAVRHPDGLAGLVLVDSSHEDQMRRITACAERNHLEYWRRVVQRQLTPLGVLRVAQDLGIRNGPSDAGGVIAQTRRGWRADTQEMVCHGIQQIYGAAPPDLADLPLMVVTAGAQARGDWESVWQEMQTELVALSTRSTQVFAENAGHHINRDDPEFLVRVLRDVITELRHG